MTYQRVFGIVLDSVGIGEAPDALSLVMMVPIP